LNNEIKALQGKTIKKLEDQLGFLTGGNTYPYILPLANSKNPNMYSLQFWAIGKYPLYNFKMKISVIYNGKSETLIESHKPESEIRQMSPTIIPEKNGLNLDNYPNLELLIESTAKNSSWQQRIKFRKDSAKNNYDFKTSVIPLSGDQTPLSSKDFTENPSLGPLSNMESLNYKKN
ncbi:MAG: hypothetical protein AB3N18_07960, partial [Allomuricauda sp.]